MPQDPTINECVSFDHKVSVAFDYMYFEWNVNALKYPVNLDHGWSGPHDKNKIYIASVVVPITLRNISSKAMLAIGCMHDNGVLGVLNNMTGHDHLA